MNATIQGIIDHMFKDTAVTAETRALHEELLNNCLEHYDDLIGRGMSETEAIDAVVDSLKGMKEVIDEYPKKKTAAAEEEKKQEIPVIETAPKAEAKKEEAPPEEKPSEYTFSADDVKKLKTELKNCDLKIGASGDGRIHVRCEDMEQLQCSLDNGVLNVRILDKAKKSLEEAGREASRQMNSNEFSLKGLMNLLGKAIGSAASSITVSWNVYIDMPAVSLQEMDLNAKSGDISVHSVLPRRLSIHTMSGDAEAVAADGNKADTVTMSAMSGEIDFRGNADQITASSMSGDVEVRGNFRNAELKSTSGDVKFNGEAENVRLNSVSGDAEADLRNTDVRSIQAKSTSGDVEVELASGTNSAHIRTSTVSGSVHCSVPDGGNGAPLQIDAGSVSGDVTIR